MQLDSTAAQQENVTPRHEPQNSPKDEHTFCADEVIEDDNGSVDCCSVGA